MPPDRRRLCHGPCDTSIRCCCEFVPDAPAAAFVAVLPSSVTSATFSYDAPQVLKPDGRSNQVLVPHASRVVRTVARGHKPQSVKRHRRRSPQVLRQRRQLEIPTHFRRTDLRGFRQHQKGKEADVDQAREPCEGKGAVMSLMSVVLVLVIVGVLLGLVNRYVPMDGRIQTILNVVVVVAVVLWLLYGFGALSRSPGIRLFRMR
jgi:hypothetical protein